MADLIQMISDFFDAVVNFITSLVDGLSIVWTACGNVFTGLVDSIGVFPSAIGGIILVSASLLIVLRVVGR